MNHGPDEPYGIARLALSRVAPPLLRRELPPAAPPLAMRPLDWPFAPLEPDVGSLPARALIRTNSSPGAPESSAACRHPVIFTVGSVPSWAVGLDSAGLVDCAPS